jgi:hypothetical protein
MISSTAVTRKLTLLQTHLFNDLRDMNPELIDQWFPIEQQRNYISMLLNPRRVGLTRRRAECFVRLWTYLLLKQQQELGARLRQPLTQLQIPEGFVACTHREAAELFYANKDRGSDRAAGMMIDILATLGLIEKDFDGNTVCLQIRSVPNLTENHQPNEQPQLEFDAFNPRTDAVPVASFLAHNYNWMNKTATAVPHKIKNLLRSWAMQYPTGMRVLRCSVTSHPVGFYILYPVAPESEEQFSLPPSKSLHLSSVSDIDPLSMAIIGQDECTSVMVRSWMLDKPHKSWFNVRRFLEDVQQTLVRMQTDFPNLCDLYALIIHPRYEELTQTLGFQKIGVDPKFSVYWMYIPIDQFLVLDIAEAVSKLEFAYPTPEF